MRANLSRGKLINERAALAVKDGRVQLQRVAYDAKGIATVEALSQWRPVEMVVPSVGMLSFHVRAANAYADCGKAEHAEQAMKMAHGCFK